MCATDSLMTVVLAVVVLPAMNVGCGLVNITLQDQQLAKSLFTDPRPSLLNFAAGLIRECLSGDTPVASQNLFSCSLDVLSQLTQAGKGNETFVAT